MSSTASELLKDPLFQLNTVPWLAQPLPEGNDITPLFYRQGFTVYAIAPLLGPPPDLRLVAQEAGINMQDRVRPDVVLTRESDRKFAFIECKAGFSALDSSISQVRGLVVVAGSRSAEILGLASEEVSDSLLGLVLPEDDREPVTKMIADLRKELSVCRLPAARFSLAGLHLTDGSIGVVIDESGEEFFSLPCGSNPFLSRELGTDPRPLYFIPYDPDVVQSVQEQGFCKRVLFERMHSTVVTAAGRANPPIEFVLKSHNILNDAMFGMYEHWENADSARHMRRVCRQFMDSLAQTVNDAVGDTMSYEPGKGWRIIVPDETRHEKLLDAVTRFSCETLALEEDLGPDLLDSIEDD